MDAQILKAAVKGVIPPLTFSSHKGQAGRIGIIGGCKTYTGAPYFAAISALKVGCDLVHVFCTKEASSVIKSYSPELIVHPILDSSNCVDEILLHLPYLHSLVIGPGLGRNPDIFESIRYIIDFSKERDLPLVFDADGLFYLNEVPDCVFSYKKAILTPNKVEFGRLYSAVTKKQIPEELTADHVQDLAKLLGNVTIVKKGPVDIISDGDYTTVCDEQGCPRRCGGQGDLLSGSMGTLNFWAHNFKSISSSSENLNVKASFIAAFGACLLTRRCSYLAFQKFGRSTITTNLIDEIHTAFSSLFVGNGK